MLERIIIVGIIAIVGLVIYYALRRRQLDKVTAHVQIDPILSNIQLDQPIIVYFTTPGCIPCKTQQQPALKRLQDHTPVQIIQIDAAEKPDTAQRWGVMTAPTTFVLGKGGKPEAVNYGAVDEHMLLKQLQAAR